MRLVVALLLLFSLSSPSMADPISDRIYPAPNAPLTIEGLPAGVELVQVTTADGLQLRGLAAAGRAGAPVLLVLHGNGFSAADVARWFAPALARGYGLVAAEYRGYSANPGRPSEAGLAQDADAFLALARRRAGGSPVWIVGHSLGGGVALPLAVRAPPDVLVTIGTLRLRDMVPAAIRLIVPDHYRTSATAPRLRRPWFLIHGLADAVVPATNARALQQEATRAGLAGAGFALSGQGHNPDGALLADIFDRIRDRPAEGLPSTAGLPSTVRLIPFQRAR